jgi:hypothetical protein
MNKMNSWTLSKEELFNIGNGYFDTLIACSVCGYRFSLQEGLKEAFSSDNPFIIHSFQYNDSEHGKVEIQIGQLKTIKFAKPFENAPRVYLTPYNKPVAAVPGCITREQFSIFSSDSGTGDQTREIGWAAFGNRKYGAMPIWRELLASSKEHQLRENFRQELVDLETAFEVFIGEYLGENLDGKLKDELVDWIFKLSLHQQLRAGFIALTGKSLHELQPEAHARWQKNVKQLRDAVVHKGFTVNSEQAREARQATFDFITRIDYTTIDHFAQ